MQGIPGHISMPTNRRPLTVDADFLNRVLDRFKWQQVALRDIEPVRDAVADILRLLEIELESQPGIFGKERSKSAVQGPA